MKIKTTHLPNLDFFLSEAFNEAGKSFTFTQGATKKESEDKLKDKLKNYYHLPI